MIRRILLIFNVSFAVLTALFFVLTVGFTFSKTPEETLWNGPKAEKPFPQNGFASSDLSYEHLAETLLQLSFSPPKLQLPDLSKVLTYLGASGRPDAVNQKNSVYFALSNHNQTAPLSPGEKLYLLYNREEKPAKYVFSPHNEPTPLWIEVDPAEKNATVTLYLLGEEGELISSPPKHHQFSLAVKEFNRTLRPEAWEIGSWRVDGTLLARQKAKWFGEDLFIDRHGGEEFGDLQQKERIDFGEGDESYFVFLKEGETLVWENNQWQAREPGIDTKNKPLLQLKKVAERLLTFDLWSPDGTSRVSLNLLKSQERFAKEKLESEFKFIATKTRSQYVFDVDGKKMTLKPQDWLVKTEEGWVKLETAQDIDLYVERKIQGPLFVFDGTTKQGDKQVLTATLFNSSRTEMESFELDVPTSAVTVLRLPKDREHLVENRLRQEKD